MKYYQFIKYKLIIVLLVLASDSINTVMAYSLSNNVLKFQQKLAKKGDPYAQYRLGVMYESGFGVEVDFDEALKWYKKSSRQNNNAATRRINYIDILKNGYQVEEDAAWLDGLKQDAAADGEAMLLLGIMYKNGTAVDKNLNMSYKYLKKAVVKDVSGAEDELIVVKELLEVQKKQDIENEGHQVEEALVREKEEKTRKKAEAKKRRLTREKRKQRLARKKEEKKAKRRRVIILKGDNAVAQQKADNVADAGTKTASVEEKGLSWAETVELERKKQAAGN
ncbi:hypothetical protein MNBD_GAMMA11-2792 [hydrothermal vent metagenome]|uniref:TETRATRICOPEPTIDE REPEAT FAMILY PROTEIN n=1 Tax=hydrothermal vent metagenome TaxID=652676 RepID=A0A3B0WXY2_9ZZZZ